MPSPLETGRNPEEPTVLDVAQATGPSESTSTSRGGGSATGVDSALSFVGPPTSVSAATAHILGAEEQARTVALLRLVLAAAIAGLFAIWLQDEGNPGRVLASVVTAITGAACVVLLWHARKVERFAHAAVLAFGVCCAVTILVMVYYVGVFSPAIVAMCIGIYFFGLSDSSLGGRLIYGAGALGYLVLNLAAILGVVDTSRSVLALANPPVEGMVAVTVVCQVLFFATFVMARSSRRATLMAFERVERALRQIKKRDALLDEARAELEGERAAKLGRYTDQQLGTYTIADVIGRGAMGEVYRGWDTARDRAVALKFLNPSLIADQENVQRFFREVEVAKRLESEHVVQLYDHGVTAAGAPYLVMELLEGRDLAQHLREKKRLGMSAVVELVMQVADALAVADQAKIVHRDLKPQNLFLSERGNRRVWKVLDFGVSKILDGAENLTMGAAVGTPSYMSPEQARAGDVDHRADVFALGVVAYRTLTGRPAFTASDSVATLYNVVHVQPARPSELVRVTEDVDRVIALALAKAPERRFSSALMLATALREAARERLDPRLRTDADALLTEHPWGKDILRP